MPGVPYKTFHPILVITLTVALALTIPAIGNEHDPENAIEAVEALPVPNMNNMVATDGQHIYAFGGRTSDTALTRDILRIDPETMEAESAGKLPVARAAGSVAYLQGKFYVFGGIERTAGSWTGSDRIVEYDPQTEESTQLTVATLPSSLFNTAAATNGDRIYIFGGYRFDPPDRRDRIIEFDPSSSLNPVRTLSPRLPYPVDSASAVYDGERFLVVGGLGDGSKVWDSIVRFNSATQSVSTGAYTLPQGLRTAAAGVHNGTTYIFGGGTTTTLRAGTDAIVEINRTAASTVNATLHERRWAAGVGIVHEHAYLVGGRTDADDYTRDITRIDLTRLHLHTPEPVEDDPPEDESKDEEDPGGEENETSAEVDETDKESPTETTGRDADADPEDNTTGSASSDDEGRMGPQEEVPAAPVVVVLLLVFIGIMTKGGRRGLESRRS